MTLTATRVDRVDAVQAAGRRPVDLERRRLESLAVFGVFTTTYVAAGYWLVVRLHVVGFETLDRLNRGLMLWHNEPAKLSAVGFDYPPLSTLAVAPLAAVPSLASSLVVVPVASAVAAALTITVLNTMLRRARVAWPARVLVLAGLGLNPLVVMHAALGGRTFLWLALVVAAVGALVAWYVTADVRFILVAGVCLGLASLTGYSSLAYAAVAAVVVAALLSRLGAGRPEIEGTTIGLASPAVYAVGLWTVLCLLLLGRPLAWISDNSDSAASAGLDRAGLGDVVSGTGRMLLDGAPLAVLVLPVLVGVGLVRRNGLALGLAALLATAILLPGVSALLGLSDAPPALAGAVPVLVLAVAGATWLLRSAAPRTPAALALGLALVASIPWTFAALPGAEHQSLERAFHDAVATGESQEGVRTPAGTVVGYDEEQAMGDYLRTHLTRPDSVLTDNAQTYAVMLFSERPDLFVDRVDDSEEAWERAAADPGSMVDYLLLSTDTTYDLLSRRYPDAAQGTDPGLREVFATDRYRLVEVPGGPTSPTSATRSAPHAVPSALGSTR